MIYRVGPTTDRLEMRAMALEDAEAAFLLNSDPEVMRYTGEDPWTSIEQARDLIASYPDFEVVGYGRWALVLREEQRVIGFCGLKWLEELGEVDVGYRLMRDYWGRGLATEACRATIEFGFETLELDRILALVLPGNQASIRVAQKCGMRPDGEWIEGAVRALRFCIERSR